MRIRAINVVCCSRYEEIVVERSLKPWLFPNFIFYHSKLGESFEELAHFMWPFINQVLLSSKAKTISRISCFS
jgi:hypothetical protein